MSTWKIFRTSDSPSFDVPCCDCRYERSAHFARAHCVGRRAPSARLNIPWGIRFRRGARHPQWTGRRPTLYLGGKGGGDAKDVSPVSPDSRLNVPCGVTQVRLSAPPKAAAPGRAPDAGRVQVGSLCAKIAVAVAHALAGQNIRTRSFRPPRPGGSGGGSSSKSLGTKVQETTILAPWRATMAPLCLGDKSMKPLQ